MQDPQDPANTISGGIHLTQLSITILTAGGLLLAVFLPSCPPYYFHHIFTYHIFAIETFADETTLAPRTIVHISPSYFYPQSFSHRTQKYYPVISDNCLLTFTGQLSVTYLLHSFFPPDFYPPTFANPKSAFGFFTQRTLV